ncbi:hypothetical protein [Budvicia aquatica]|uniref:Uncharacterized protein n=1 Tax=Budvicia aquatica TaxID=82979 RepID=A0A484ZYY9_9GAMM|nr:hypothetical protein [Budvicia aquatica]VFS53590.1 Uncharacterised protein [Budvicia aquatica]
MSGINADPQAIANHLFNRFTDMVSSPNEKLTYLSETAYVKQQTESIGAAGETRLANGDGGQGAGDVPAG